MHGVARARLLVEGVASVVAAVAFATAFVPGDAPRRERRGSRGAGSCLTTSVPRRGRRRTNLAVSPWTSTSRSPVACAQVHCTAMSLLAVPPSTGGYERWCISDALHGDGAVEARLGRRSQPLGIGGDAPAPLADAARRSDSRCGGGGEGAGLALTAGDRPRSTPSWQFNAVRARCRDTGSTATPIDRSCHRCGCSATPRSSSKRRGARSCSCRRRPRDSGGDAERGTFADAAASDRPRLSASHSFSTMRAWVAGTSRQQLSTKKLVDDVWWRFQERMDKGEDKEAGTRRRWTSRWTAWRTWSGTSWTQVRGEASARWLSRCAKRFRRHADRRVQRGYAWRRV